MICMGYYFSILTSLSSSATYLFENITVVGGSYITQSRKHAGEKNHKYAGTRM